MLKWREIIQYIFYAVCRWSSKLHCFIYPNAVIVTVTDGKWRDNITYDSQDRHIYDHWCLIATTWRCVQESTKHDSLKWPLDLQPFSSAETAIWYIFLETGTLSANWHRRAYKSKYNKKWHGNLQPCCLSICSLWLHWHLLLLPRRTRRLVFLMPMVNFPLQFQRATI